MTDTQTPFQFSPRRLHPELGQAAAFQKPAFANIANTAKTVSPFDQVLPQPGLGRKTIGRAQAQTTSGLGLSSPQDRIKFQGYRLTAPPNPSHMMWDGQLYLAVDPSRVDRVEAEVLRPGETQTSIVEMTHQGQSGYYTTDELELDFEPVYDESTGQYSNYDPLYYRFRVYPHGVTDPAQAIVVHDVAQLKAPVTNLGQFNAVSGAERFAPRKNVNIIDVFQDSAVSKAVLEKLKETKVAGKPYIMRRNNFNQFSGGREGLTEIMELVKRHGFNAMLLKPFIGADTVSSHGYWTIDPMVLNNTFDHKADFDAFLVEALKNDVKIFADGAFVNQGLNGVQFESNLAHGYNSPYWDWFTFDYDSETLFAQKDPRNIYPSVTDPNARVRLGLLPTTINPRTGQEDVDYSNVAVRIVNPPPANPANRWWFGLAKAATAPMSWFGFQALAFDPVKHYADEHYDPRQRTYIEFSVPQLEKNNPANPKGKMTDGVLKRSYDSMQNVRFPVDVQDVYDHLAGLRQMGFEIPEATEEGLILVPTVEQSGGLDLSGKSAGDIRDMFEVLTQWNRFVIVDPGNDNSAYKWDGKIDVVKMNVQNGEVQQYVSTAMTYWTRYVRNLYLQHLSAQMADRSGNPQQRMEAVWNALAAPENRNQSFENLERVRAVKPFLEKLYTPVNADQIPETLAHRLLTEYPISALPLPSWFKGVLTFPALNGEPELAGKLEQLHLPDNYPTTNWLRQEKPFGFYRLLTWPLNLVRNSGWEWGKQQLAKIDDWCSPQTFEQHMAKQIQIAMREDLPEDVREKLRSPLVQSVIADQLMEGLYLKWMTGLPILEARQASPESLEQGLLDTLPADVLKGDPEYSARQLKRVLKQKTRELQAPDLVKALTELTRGLDHQSLLWADAMVRVREFGMNWRLDAAKDMGDMDRVRNAGNVSARYDDPSTERRAEIFREETEKAVKFWQLAGGNLRKIFPQSIILGEQTDYWPVSGGNHPKADAIRQDMIDRFTVATTSLPNYNVYNRFVRMVADGQEAEKDGQVNARGIFEQFRGNISEVNWPAARFYQNMPSNHDKAIDTHLLLINSHLARMDYQKYIPMTMFLRESLTQLFHKPDMEPMLRLAQEQIGGAASTDGLRRLLLNPMLWVGRQEDGSIQAMGVLENILSDDVKLYLTGDTRQEHYADSHNDSIAVGLPIRKKLVDQLFEQERMAVVPADAQWFPPEYLVPTEWQDVEKIITDLVFNPKAFQARNYPLEDALALINGGSLDAAQQISPYPGVNPSHQAAEAIRQHLRQLNVQLHNALGLELSGEGTLWDKLADKYPDRASSIDHLRQAFNLKALLLDRILEPSEAMAMRATLVNTLEGTMDGREMNPNFWSLLAQRSRNVEFGMDDQNALKERFYTAIHRAEAFYGRQFGYQPLEDVLDSILEFYAAPREEMQTPQFLNAFRSAFYEVAMRPVAEKMRRVAALQTAIVGSPSVELHSFLMQTGGDSVVPANMYVQNRAIFRQDWSDPQSPNHKSFVTDYQQDIQRLMGLRNNYPALTNGFWMDLEPPADDAGVFTIGRDNGEQQVLMVINTGKPSPLNYYGNGDLSHRPGDIEEQYSAGKTGHNVKERARRYNYPTSTDPVAHQVTVSVAPRLNNYRPSLDGIQGPNGMAPAECMANITRILSALTLNELQDKETTKQKIRVFVQPEKPAEAGGQDRMENLMDEIIQKRIELVRQLEKVGSLMTSSEQQHFANNWMAPATVPGITPGDTFRVSNPFDEDDTAQQTVTVNPDYTITLPQVEYGLMLEKITP